MGSPHKIDDAELARRIKLANETKLERAAEGKSVLMTVHDWDRVLDPDEAQRHSTRSARTGKPSGSRRI